MALGNPGADHARDRHNAGFWLADALVRRWGESFGAQRKFKSELAKYGAGDTTLWLQKPLTFMNVSGSAVQPFCAFHKMTPSQLLVVHDDLDLPPGTARLKRGGGHGGHNGLRDITRAIGADFNRLRIGIGHPGDRSRVLGHVLAAPGADEQGHIERAIDAGMDAIETIMDGGWDKGVQQLHSLKQDVS